MLHQCNYIACCVCRRLTNARRRFLKKIFQLVNHRRACLSLPLITCQPSRFQRPKRAMQELIEMLNEVRASPPPLLHCPPSEDAIYMLTDDPFRLSHPDHTGVSGLSDATHHVLMSPTGYQQTAVPSFQIDPTITHRQDGAQPIVTSHSATTQHTSTIESVSPGPRSPPSSDRQPCFLCTACVG